MTWLESLESWGKQVFSGDYLPITVTAAIVLFVVKELLEIRRRRAERLRKTKAVKLLLSQELEKNHWALISFFRILDILNEAQDDAPRAVFSLHVARNGSEHFRMKEEPEDEDESGKWIPPFSTKLYEELIATLAEYDHPLYEVVNQTYEVIIELMHYRETLTSFLARETLAPVDLTYRFLAGMAEEKNDYYNALNKAYRALTGNDLKESRLR
jgi:hypothetical protein